MTPAGEKTLVELLEKHSDQLEKLITAHNENVAVVKALREKIATLESRGIEYRGIFQRAQDYQRGDVVTFSGSMFIALKETRDEPGNSPNWQLAVKGTR